MSQETAAAPIQTMRRRFLITLTAQIVRSGLSFLTGLLVARGLGPGEYGNLAFLLGSFTGLRLILDLSSGQAFFTLAAQRPRSRAFYIYYTVWLTLFEIAIPLLFLVLLLPHNVVNTLWQSQARERVCLAFLASALQYLIWPQIIQLGEVVRRTQISQLLTIAISIGQFLIVLVLHLLALLTLPTFLIATTLAFLAGGVSAFMFLPRPWHADVEPESFAAVFGEFLGFCRPLVVSMSLWAATGWIEVWLIQHFAGSVAQGYYALGTQLSLIGLVATTALQNIFWREVAELEGKGDEIHIRESFLKTSRALLLTAAVPIAFLIPWTPEFIHLTLGAKYHDAAPAVAVLFLYPISQPIVTLSIIMFSVMRQTRALATFSCIHAVLYIATTYLLLAPSTALVPGLGLGALGFGLSAFALGAKMAVFGFGQAFVWEYWINRMRSWRSDWPHRLKFFAILVGFSAVTRFVGGVAAIWMPTLVAMIISGVLFLALNSALALWRPGIMGIPEEFMAVWRNRLTQGRAPKYLT